MCVYVCVCAHSLQSCLTLCYPVAYRPQCSSVPGILQARILRWVAMPSSRESFQPRAQTQIFIVLVHAKLLQSHLTLSDPMDCSPPVSSVNGIFQARILEWFAIAGDLPDPGIKSGGLPHCRQILYCLIHQ